MSFDSDDDYPTVSSNQGPWLIKSSGRILGPFETQKIGDLLRTREISVLDEVSPPFRRWQTIQYIEDFKEIVESLRKASLSERTEATWTPGTANLTQTVTDLADAELTEELTAERMGFTMTDKEIVVHDVQEKVDRPPPSQSAGRYLPSHQSQNQIQKQTDQTTKGLWVVTLLVLLSVAAFVFYRRMTPPQGSVNKPSSGPSLRKVVLEQMSLGQYAEALQELKRFFPDPMQSGDLAIYFGALLIHVDQQSVMGRRLLSQVAQTKSPDLKQAYTGLGLADLIDRQFEGAKENFKMALGIDTQFVPALINLSVTSLLEGRHAQAKEYAEQALSISPNQSEALLALADAELYLLHAQNEDPKRKSERDLRPIRSRLESAKKKNFDHSSEIHFFSLYFDYLAQEKNLEEKMIQFLDQDPQMTEEHRHNVFIYRGRVDWKIMARFCEQMVSAHSEEPRWVTLRAACRAHEGRFEQARADVLKAVTQSPKDPLIQAWYAYIYKISGDADQSSVILGRATEANRKGEYRLPTLLQAKFCKNLGDVDCARQNYQRLFERDLNDLTAIAGLAWVYSKQNSFGEAVKFIEKGLQISPDYIPLLQLQRRAEVDGWYATK